MGSIIYNGSLRSIKTISAPFPGRNLETIVVLRSLVSNSKEPPRHPTNQQSDQPAFVHLILFFSHNSHGIQAVDKEGPVPERSSFSFNERAWEAWDPWDGASVSEPAVLPPLRPPLSLTFQVLQLLRRKTSRRKCWSLRFIVINGDIIMVLNCRYVYCVWNIIVAN